MGPPQADGLLHGGSARGLPRAGARPGRLVPGAPPAAADRRSRRSQAPRWDRPVRPPALYRELAPGWAAREPRARQGPGPLAESGADLRSLWTAALLPPPRARLLR